MKEIIVNEANLPKLEQAIAQEQGKARERLLTAQDVVKALQQFERELAIPKKCLEGVKVSVDVNAQDFPRAYKWTPESTQFTAIRRGGKWRVTSICRYKCCASGHKFGVWHTGESRQAIIDRFTEF